MVPKHQLTWIKNMTICLPSVEKPSIRGSVMLLLKAPYRVKAEFICCFLETPTSNDSNEIQAAALAATEELPRWC